ncbi:MAG: hypothetical protein V1792_14275 [Pseudomonadota bacterium]
MKGPAASLQGTRVGGSSGDTLAGRRINAGEFVEDFRSGLTDLDLMLKYELDEDDLRVLFKKLLAANMLSKDDLQERPATVSRAPGSSPAAPVPVESSVRGSKPAMPDRRDTIGKAPALDPQGCGNKGKTKVCPSCSRAIPSEAVRCDHCRTRLDGSDWGPDPDIAATGDRSHALKVMAKGIAGMLIGLIMLLFGGKVGLLVGTLVLLGCTGYYVWGCCVYIGTKGYQMSVGLLGLVPCFLGLAILLLMPEK